MNHQVEAQTSELDAAELDQAVGGVTPTETEMLACRKAGGSSNGALVPAVQSSIIGVL